MTKIEFRGKCPLCKRERAIFGPRQVDTPDQLDSIEQEIDRCGGAIARCPTCDAVEDVAMFVDGQQQEPWTNADKYDEDNGEKAGPLPPKP